MTETPYIPRLKEGEASFATKMCFLGIVNNTISQVKLAIFMGADVNFINKETEKSLLCLACTKEHEDIGIELLKHDAIDITSIGDYSTGDTPLHIACKKNLPIIVDIILNKNPNTAHIFNYEGFLPLHMAAQYGHERCVTIILNKNPQTAHMRCKNGNLPLHSAIYNEHKNCIESLITAYNNKNIDTQNYTMSTALHIACAKPSNESFDTSYTVKEMIVIACPKPSDESFDIIKQLIVKGASTTIKNNIQATPLLIMFSCVNSNNEFNNFITKNPGFAKELINAIDKYGNNQLHLCATCQSINDDKFDQYLQFLISHGVNIWSKNKDGKLPVDLACDAFTTLYNEYRTTKLPYLEKALTIQERVMHSFLRVTSPYTPYAVLSACLSNVSLPKEIITHIAHDYNQINSETVVAKKYKNDKTYYDDFIENKENIKKELRDNPKKF
ncbi:MAG TPA: ankyrin repeat domain-containing protein [Candidatus Babeliales bacterium]|nr:ankyrin repeat domain-containing protein [Candidatus Babeliales bacterium]